MKRIGTEIGVNESRVSQLHARAIQRLRKALAADFSSADAERALVLAFERKKNGNLPMAKASMPTGTPATVHAITSRAARSSSASRNGFASQRQPLSSRNRSASVPATSPVTKITRCASAGMVAATRR